MNRNMILAILLSSAIYIFWFAYVSPPKPEGASQTINQTQVEKNTSKTVSQKEIAQAAIPVAIDKEKKKNPPLIVKSQKANFIIDPSRASLIDVVYHGPISDVNLSLSEDANILSTLKELDWKVLSIKEGYASFSAKLSKDISVKKTFKFATNPAINEMELEFKNNSSSKMIIPSFPLSMGPGLGTVGSELKENPKICESDYTFQESGKKHPTLAKIKDSVEKEDWIWAGINNRYFLMAVINDGELGRMAVSKEKIGKEDYPHLNIYTKEFKLNKGEAKTIKIPFYAGAKDYKLLKALGFGLDRSVDFGFFSPLAKMADSSLQYFYSKTGNYGVAIIILSVVIQLLIFPLSMKSYKAMAVMKKLQPEMQALQQKYKDDPKMMNAELMQLYKKYGANPLSGCWPMLLQLPIFFALFTALRNSWNLHGAHFAFWIKDLSAKDPYYVLPILMGALMFLQQHLNPQTGGDPTQNKIMKWMPVLFTFMFLSFPSGLVIYWIINSLFSLGQTLYLKEQESK